MSKLEYDRIYKAVRKGINLNPHNISIEVSGKEIVDGSYKKFNNKFECIGIVYPMKNNEFKIESANVTADVVNKNFEMIVLRDELEQDLIYSESFNSKVKCIEGTFTLTYVNPIVVEEQIVCYQCGLKAVN